MKKKSFVQSDILYQSMEWSGLLDPKWGFKVEVAEYGNNDWDFRVWSDHPLGLVWYIHYEGGDRWFIADASIIPYNFKVLSKHRSMLSMVDGLLNIIENSIDGFYLPEWSHEFKFGENMNDQCVD